MAKSEEFDQIVLPGMDQEWEIVKKKWFVPDPKCKTPGFSHKGRSLFKKFIGLMKIEAQISSGSFLALSPKCYWLGDEKAEKRFI